jgi:hypothetical protein
MNKRGQVTIFIIVAIVIVSGVALFFLLRSGLVPGSGGKADENSNSFLESCIEDKLRKTIELISLQGGYVENPHHVYFKFEDESTPQKISYLCYTQENSVPCINQEPMLISHLEDEIKNDISGEVNNCFRRLVENLEGKGYSVNDNYKGFEVDLMEGRVNINLDDSEITLTKSGETTTQENFEVSLPSKIYDLAYVAQDLVGYETEDACVLDPLNFIGYPDIQISWKESRMLDKNYRIYKLKHSLSREGFRFAVRGCVVK